MLTACCADCQATRPKSGEFSGDSSFQGLVQAARQAFNGLYAKGHRQAQPSGEAEDGMSGRVVSRWIADDLHRRRPPRRTGRSQSHSSPGAVLPRTMCEGRALRNARPSLFVLGGKCWRFVESSDVGCGLTEKQDATWSAASAHMHRSRAQESKVQAVETQTRAAHCPVAAPPTTLTLPGTKPPETPGARSVHLRFPPTVLRTM